MPLPPDDVRDFIIDKILVVSIIVLLLAATLSIVDFIARWFF